MTWFEFFDTLMAGLGVGCLIGLSLGVGLPAPLTGAETAPTPLSGGQRSFRRAPAAVSCA